MYGLSFHSESSFIFLSLMWQVYLLMHQPKPRVQTLRMLTQSVCNLFFMAEKKWLLIITCQNRSPSPKHKRTVYDSNLKMFRNHKMLIKETFLNRQLEWTWLSEYYVMESHLKCKGCLGGCNGGRHKPWKIKELCSESEWARSQAVKTEGGMQKEVHDGKIIICII